MRSSIFKLSSLLTPYLLSSLCTPSLGQVTNASTCNFLKDFPAALTPENLSETVSNVTNHMPIKSHIPGFLDPNEHKAPCIERHLRQYKNANPDLLNLLLEKVVNTLKHNNNIALPAFIILFKLGLSKTLLIDGLSPFHFTFVDDEYINFGNAAELLKLVIDPRWNILDAHMRNYYPDHLETYEEEKAAFIAFYSTYHLLQSLREKLARGDEVLPTPPKAGLSFLNCAILLNDLPLVEKILAHGTFKAEDLNEPDILGNLATDYLQGTYDFVPLLLSAGFNPLAKNNKGETILMSGINDLSPETLSALIAQGAPPLARDHYGNHALHFLTDYKPETIRIFTEIGLSLDDVNQEGRTPFDRFVSLGSHILELERFQLTSDPLYHFWKQLALGEPFSMPQKPGVAAIGIPTVQGLWSTHILHAGRTRSQKDPEIQFSALPEKLIKNSELLKLFDGFITPGSSDSYPKNRPFSIHDLKPERMIPTEIAYQAINQVSSEHQIPLMGYCAGNQHIALYHGATLNKVSNYAGKDHQVVLVPGSFPYYLSLTMPKLNTALETCNLPTVIFRRANTAFSFAALPESFEGKGLRLGALCEGGVVQAVDYGAFKVGFQFHPENFYGRNNRQGKTIDHMFDFMKQSNKVRHKENSIVSLVGEVNKALERMQECERLRGNTCPPLDTLFTEIYDESMGEE